jgi:hypothetical protein
MPRLHGRNSTAVNFHLLRYPIARKHSQGFCGGACASLYPEWIDDLKHRRPQTLIA